MKHIQILFLLVGLLSCSDSNKPDETPTLQYDRKTLLQNTFKEVIIPSIDNSVTTIQLFETTIHNHSLPLSDTALKTLKMAWQKSKHAWEGCEIFDLGYVRGNYTSLNIDYWPTNTALLNQRIADTSNTFTSTYLDYTSPATRGFASIECLLFEENALTQLNHDSVRWSYLLLASSDLSQQINTFKKNWLAYEHTFINESGTGVSASINILVNKIISELEFIINTELNTPLGIKNSGTPLPLSLESPYSKYTAENIRASLKSIEQIYFGINPSSTSLSTMVAFLEKSDLNDKIKNQFEACYLALDQLKPNIYGLLVSNQKNEVASCYSEIRKLMILIRVDVVSTLSISLTISDNDGD